MRLIDAEAYEQALIANDWDKDTDEFSTEGVFELLHDETTVQAIPLDEVKQARREIHDLERYFDNDLYTDNEDSMFKCNEVLAILDKLIESEE